MVYVMSDLHGCYEKYVKMLEKISFSKEDVLYILGGLSDGGKSTLEEFLTLSEEEREIVLNVLRKSLISKEIEVNGKKFLLAHTIPEVDFICDYEEWTEEDYTMGEPDYEEVYFDDMQVVTGHTPTAYIDRNFAGRIWMDNHHIAIDCGAVFGYSLGCLCLDTMEEFYEKN